MAEAFICDYIRTPIGRFGGKLSSVRADDLGAVPLKALQERHNNLDWGEVDEVIFGCANQAGEDNRNVARMSLLLARLPETIPGTTINRLCGSGMGCDSIDLFQVEQQKFGIFLRNDPAGTCCIELQSVSGLQYFVFDYQSAGEELQKPSSPFSKFVLHMETAIEVREIYRCIAVQAHRIMRPFRCRYGVQGIFCLLLVDGFLLIGWFDSELFRNDPNLHEMNWFGIRRVHLRMHDSGAGRYQLYFTWLDG